MIDVLALLRVLLVRLVVDLVPTRPESAEHDGAEVVPLETWRRRAASSSRTGEGAAPAPPPLELSRHLQPEPAAVSKAREALEPLGPVVDADAFNNVRLLVSELVTNSVRHGSHEGAAPIELSVLAAQHRVRAEVVDGGAGFTPAARSEGDDEGSGWGLHLVELLSDSWGVERNGRTAVWFELEAAFEPQWWLEEAANGDRDVSPQREPHPPTRWPEGVVRRLGAVRSSLARRQAAEADVD